MPITVPILSFLEYSDTNAKADGNTLASEIPINMAGINIVEELIVNETKNMDKLSNNNPNIIFYENDYTENRLHERTEAPGFVSDNITYDERVIRPVRQMPINIRTRGYPTEYQQIGILTNRENLKDDMIYIKPNSSLIPFL